MPTRTPPPAIVPPAQAGTSLLFPPNPPPRPQHRTLRVQGSPCQGVGAEPAPAKAGGLPCCLEVVSRPPLRRPRPYLRRVPGCSPVVSYGIRLIAAPRGSNPRSHNNPQAGPPLPTAGRRDESKLRPTPSRLNLDQPQTCIAAPPRIPRHGSAGKNARRRNESTFQGRRRPGEKPSPKAYNGKRHHWT